MHYKFSFVSEEDLGCRLYFNPYSPKESMAGQSFGKSHCEFRPNHGQIIRLDSGSYVDCSLIFPI